jgi:putative tricarboxylic transport membrane protein
MTNDAPAELQDTAEEPRGIPWGDWAIALALLAMGVIVFLDGFNQDESRSASGVGAGFMPEVVGAVLIGLAIALCIQVARGHLGEAEEAEGDVDVRRTQWVPLAVCAAAVIFFILAVETLGYVVVSSIAFWLTAWAMGARNHLRSALIAIVLSLVIYLAFTRLLDISLPPGILEGVL